MGETHEKKNKNYLAKQIADEIAKRILKVNIYGYDLWYPYTITVGPYDICSEMEIDIVKDMGEPAREVDIMSTTCDFQIAWDPGRPAPDSEGNKIYYPEIVTSGSKLTLENKVVEKLYIHPKTTGVIKIDVEGFTDC